MERSQPTPGRNTVRVVLAEDHDVVRSALRALLDAAPGLEVIGEARNGHEAVRHAVQLRPDVVVMDLSMPVLNGIAATERIAADAQGVGVLILTAIEDVTQMRRALGCGAAGYIVKRASADDLIRAIRIIAGGGTFVDPQLAGAVIRDSARADASGRAVAARLSEREQEVVRRLAWGESNREIAAALDISTKTVETYRARISDKLGLRTRPELVRFALRQGWLRDE